MKKFLILLPVLLGFFMPSILVSRFHEKEPDILASLQIDDQTIIAGLLHDVVEDTSITREELEEAFGSTVLLLVDGVTKLSKLEFRNRHEAQAENLRRMFMAMSSDIRIILIKLADFHRVSVDYILNRTDKKEL